jgi:hypothetical protein
MLYYKMYLYNVYLISNNGRQKRQLLSCKVIYYYLNIKLHKIYNIITCEYKNLLLFSFGNTYIIMCVNYFPFLFLTLYNKIIYTENIVNL